MDLPGMNGTNEGGWAEDPSSPMNDHDEDEAYETDDSSLISGQTSAAWRANLLPRSRFLEMTVFKKMLAQGLPLRRHRKSGGIFRRPGTSPGGSFATTIFASPDFRALWWHEEAILGPRTAIVEFKLASLLRVGTATDPKTGALRPEVSEVGSIGEADAPLTVVLEFKNPPPGVVLPGGLPAGVAGPSGGSGGGGGGGSGLRRGCVNCFKCGECLWRGCVAAGLMPPPEESGGLYECGDKCGVFLTGLWARVRGGGAGGGAEEERRRRAGDDKAPYLERDDIEGAGAEVVLLTCESTEQFHVVLDGFELLLDYAEAAVFDEASPPPHYLAAPPLPLPKHERGLLWWHNFYRPEHHPNHPARVLKLGSPVEVLYSSVYVVALNDELMRLPNPFFGPGMNCRGKVLAYDADTENYTVSYIDGPFEQDENPSPEKRNFPKGTVFYYVRRASLILDTRGAFEPPWPLAALGLPLLQLAAALVLQNIGRAQAEAPKFINAMQIGFFADGCPNLTGDMWRLWTYQFLPNRRAGRLAFNLIMQVWLGVPINLAHGNLALFLLTQGLAVPLAALAVGFADPLRTVSESVVGASGCVGALLGAHLTHLVLTYAHQDHGLVSRRLRLFLLVAIAGGALWLNEAVPDPGQSFQAQHLAGCAVGALYSLAVLRTLRGTHWERTVLIPAAAYALAALAVFSVAWYFSTMPPRAVFLFTGLQTRAPPCCWTVYDCGLHTRDLKYLECRGGAKLQAVQWGGPSTPTAQVKDPRSCAAIEQYLALQVAYVNKTRTSKAGADY